MLDVRLTSYVIPVAEQPLDSITPVVRVQNFADEGAIITGLIRIYRDSTGLLEYDSTLTVTQLAAGASVDIAALTPFDPSAPADHDWFIIAEIHARSLVPPDWHECDSHLDPMYFDIKPGPMGPAPAAHHVTHEDGGMDPVDLTGMTGLTATPQTPANHASTHETGNADEINVAGLHGVLADDQPGLAHNNTKHTISYRMDFIGSDYTHAVYPYFGNAIHAGTYALLIDCPEAHPGILQISSSTQANSGQQCKTDFCILLAGGERCTCWHRPQLLAATTRHYGFHDAIDVDDPFMGAWIWQDPATGIIYGRTADFPDYSITGTGFQLVTNTWYLERIVINANATRVDFYIYAEDGTELWHDFLTSNIPTTYTTANSSVVTSSGTSINILDETDELSFYLPERRPQI